MMFADNIIFNHTRYVPAMTFFNAKAQWSQRYLCTSAPLR